MGGQPVTKRSTVLMITEQSSWIDILHLCGYTSRPWHRSEGTTILSYLSTVARFNLSDITVVLSEKFASQMHQCMMTSSNGNIFRVTDPLRREFTGPVNSPHKGQWRGALMFSLICARRNDWVNNREAGDLKRHRGHYDVNVMEHQQIWKWGSSSGIFRFQHPAEGSAAQDFDISLTSCHW